MNHIREIAYRETGSDELTSHRHCQAYTYEIIQTWSDGGNFVINDVLYPIYKGALFLINAVDMHCSLPVPGVPYVRSKLVVSSEYVDELLTAANAQSLIKYLFLENGGGSFCLSDNAEYADKLFFEMSQLVGKNSSQAQAMLGGKLLQLLSLCSECQAMEHYDSPEWLNKALEYIRSHINEEITIEQICEHIHFSKYYLCHAFKRATGMTVMQYILNRRLSEAKKKILHSSASLSEIAATTGFSGFSYFSRVFSEKEGITPSEYRRISRKNSK